MPSFANWGPCVDVLAPGAPITSAYNTTDGAYAIRNGTSQAAARVSGVIALLLQQNPRLTVLEIEELIYNTSETEIRGDLKGSPNRVIRIPPILVQESGQDQ
jgi:subtilisin family serine protease